MKFSNGALVCYSVSPSFQPKTPAQLQALARQHGLPESLCPAYAGDRAMVTRAIGAHTSRAKSAGWLVQSLETSKERVVYTIARIEKDKENERTDYTHDDVVKWSGDNGHASQVEGTHEVARQINDTYQELRGMVLSGDWTQNLIDYITGSCQGVSLKDNGHVWWVPPPGISKITALRGMLADVGIALFVSEIESENVRDVAEVAQKGLGEQLATLKAEVEAFDGTQGPSVYQSRLDQLKEWRATKLAYEGALGIHLGELQKIGDAIEQQTRELLTVRLGTVIHKDGTKETLARPSMETQLAAFAHLAALGEGGVLEALMDGRLAINGDADDVARLCGPQPERAPDTALDEAMTEVDLDPALAAMLRAPASGGQELPTTW